MIKITTYQLLKGFVISLYFFAFVMDESKKMQDDVPCYMMFVNDITLINETQRVNKLEIWRNTLECMGFMISGTKIEYIHYKCNESQR